MVVNGALRIVTEPTYSKKRRDGICVVWMCSNRCRDKHHPLCHKHAREKQKLENPARYFFDILRQRAKRRGHAFTLTIEEFRAFCQQTGYLKKKGRNAHSYSIDRINPKRGYSADNIQICTVSDNVRKRYVDEKIARWEEEHGITASIHQRFKIIEEDDPDFPKRLLYDPGKGTDPSLEEAPF